MNTWYVCLLSPLAFLNFTSESFLSDVPSILKHLGSWTGARQLLGGRLRSLQKLGVVGKGRPLSVARVFTSDCLSHFLSHSGTHIA